MDRNSYVIVYQTKGFSDLAVFTSLSAAEECFEKLVKKYNLKKAKYSFYMCQAFRKLDAIGEKENETSLTLMKKINNRCFI